MARNLLILFAFMLTSTIAMAQTSLRGKVTDGANGEAILFGNVALYKGGVLVTGVETDFDGNYNISNIDPGTYDVEATYVGLNPQRITDVIVAASKANKLDIEFSAADGVDLTEVIVTGYRVPLIEQDNTTQGGIVTADQIKTLPTKSINGLAATTAGIGASDDGGALTVRGSRSDATDYYVDGVRVRGNNLPPQSEIDQLQVITGGVAAQYGDVTGGVISLTTKGPSSRYSGGIEVETSELFDNYGYNLLSGNVSGPILKRKSDGKSILGFRLSGQYLLQADDDAPALPIYQVTDEKLAELEANPVVQLQGGGFSPAADFVTNDDINVLDYRPNEESTNLNLTAKIDARFSDAVDVTVSGSYIDATNLFTPSSNPDNTSGRPWNVYNSHNNPMDENTRYRGNFRFRHRLGGGNTGGEDKTASMIQNASYILQVGYERNVNNLEDGRHGDNYFNYGHVGQFFYDWTPIAAEADYTGGVTGPDGLNYAHADYRQSYMGADFSNSSNPVLANYNNNVPADSETDLNFSAINGQLLGDVSSSWDIHTNVGQVYNFNTKSDNDYYTLNVSTSFDLVPGGNSENGRHSIQVGFMGEQRFLRSHDLNPYALWILARGQANRHLSGVDTLSATGETFMGEEGTITEGMVFDEFNAINTEDEFEGNYFFRRVRDLTGTAINEYVNVDGINPNELTLDMFSAQELNDFSNLSLDYYGYDYLGNKLANDVSFDDFFTATDENGTRTFPVAAFQPVYAAGYIQDKFTFKDIIFRLGLRMDYYDANTRVLKDNYSLYNVMSAADFFALEDASDVVRPNGVGDDFKVYVDGDSEKSTSVRAYRDGEQWYFADGSVANDGNLIFGTTVVNPRYYAETINDIKDPDFDPNSSFEDYKPQVNWMPRLAFSFPISDEANFYANYDILVQRPGSGQARGTALDYYYIEQRPDQLYRNPNLKPQRTVTYEVGFKQKLSNTSALNVSAYYRELRDMIQRRTFLNVATPIGNYVTYDNQDFGTVKAFSFQYDRRRTNNLQLNASYTLQFADGTGSNADSQAGLTAKGNIRTLFPLDFDERHRFNLTADYRYASGKKYDGPRIAGRDIFANAGLNVQGTAVSGRPFTRNNLPTQYGGAGVIGALNGARKPWNYWLNLRVDKNFTLTKPDAKRQLNLNVYFRVQNLLDVRNVIDVYSASGSPEDDGYLTSSNGKDIIQNIESTNNRNVEAFVDAYNWELVNPGFYSLPRRMYLGATFDF